MSFFFSDGQTQALSIDDMSVLTDFSAEDLLSISLYANNDAGNILSEWSVMIFDLFDMDTNNDDGYNLPAQDDEEEKLETGSIGKLLELNIGDVNENAVPDFAEFDYGAVDHQFVPVILTLPDEMNLSSGRIVFKYDGSNPLNITQKVDTETQQNYYQPATGALRLWTKNANETRNPLPYTKVSGEGHYIEPDKVYFASDLGFNNGEKGRIKVLYLEALLASSDRGDVAIKIEVSY